MSFQTKKTDEHSDRDRNPYLAPERETAPAVVRDVFPHRRVFQILVAAKILTIVGGAVAAVVDIESIVVTGPAISLLGTGIAAHAFRAGYWQGVWFGVCGLVITVFCFLLINLQSWGPGDAQVPVSAIAVAFAAVAAPFGIAVFFWLRDPLSVRQDSDAA